MEQKTNLRQYLKSWKKRTEEPEEKKRYNLAEIQVRMISTGNALGSNKSPMYGVFFTEPQYPDPVAISRNAGIYSAIGGGAQTDAPIEFSVREGPLRTFLVKRRHDYNFENDRIVGIGFSPVGADKIAYEKAVRTARRAGKILGVDVNDQTSKDFADLSDCKSLFKSLETRVYDWANRVASAK
jgi:hypothetical protein